MSEQNNPWGLTNREVEVIRAYIAHGTQKGVARLLGICAKTVEAHCNNARAKIAGDAERNGRHLLPYILFDRWDRAQAEAPSVLPADEFANQPRSAALCAANSAPVRAVAPMEVRV
jgi:hypothetical protein